MSSRNFALLYGLVFIFIGVAGFGVIPGLLEGRSGDGLSIQGHLFGLFHVNGYHNVFHLLFGLWGLAAKKVRDAAIGYLKAILGLIPGTAGGFGLIPLAGNDVWLHLGLGGLAALVIFARRN